MRRSAICLALGLAFSVTALSATPAHANGWTNLQAGLQGIVQAPVDVLYHVVLPPEDFVDELPLGQVTGRMLGALSGPLLGAYRVVMGVTDVALSPLWIFPTMSPEARWNWFEVEYEDI